MLKQWFAEFGINNNYKVSLFIVQFHGPATKDTAFVGLWLGLGICIFNILFYF